MTQAHQLSPMRVRLAASCSRSSSSVSSCVGAPAVMGWGADEGEASFTLEETLFLVVLLRTRVERYIAAPEQGVVMRDQIALGKRDLTGVLEDGLGDLVAEILAHLVGGGDDRRRHRDGGDVLGHEAVGVRGDLV